MANQIELVTEYLPLLDEVYRANAKSAILEADPAMVRATEDAKTVKINKLDMDGLANYSRQDGYTTGSIISDWETWTFTNDRGRRFNLDKMDNLENINMVFLNMAGQFLKQKVIPEKDAYTFATIASTDGITARSGETITSANVQTKIDGDIAALGDAEVDEGNLVIFTSYNTKTALEEAIGRSLASGVDRYNQKLNYYNDIPLIAVPQNRFVDAIDLLDGKTSGQTQGGFRKHVAQSGKTGDANGVDLNYIICDRAAVLSIAKNNVAQIIAPEVNQLHDGWTFSFRFYYDVFTYENKAKSIIVSKKKS